MNKTPAPKTVQHKLAVTLLLTLLGLGGNHFSVALGYNVHFLFGSIFGILTVALLGTPWGLVTTVIASSYTVLLWNHPYAIVIFSVEVLWVGIWLRKGRTNILLIDSVYWLLVGIPLVAVFYAGVMGLGFQITQFIAIKQAVNGVFNALFASIILSHPRLTAWLKIDRQPPLIGFSQILFQFAALFLMLPALALTMLGNYRERDLSQAAALEDVRYEALTTEEALNNWLSGHIRAVEKIAGLGLDYSKQNSAALQQALQRIHGLFPDFHNVYLADASATTIAFDPPVNELGESTIGLNFADRAYFKALQSTQAPVVSEVFSGRGGVFKPIFTISVPVMDKNGRMAGYGLGAVNLERLNAFIRKNIVRSEMTISLIDQHGHIVLSSSDERNPLETMAQDRAATLIPTALPDVYIQRPGKERHVSAMKTWRDASFVTRRPINGTPWVLQVEYSIAPLQERLYANSIRSLAIVAGMFVFALGVAVVLSRVLERAPRKLVELSKDLPAKIEQDQLLSWPRTNIREMSELIDNLKQTSEALNGRIHEIRETNENLESLVREKTEALRLNEQKLAEILSSSPVAIGWTDREGRVEYLNEKFVRTFGYSKDDIPDIETWYAKAYPDETYRSRLVTAWQAAAQQSRVDNKELPPLEARITCKDSSVREMIIAGTWVQDCLLVFFSDITERKQAEELRKQMEEQLRQAYKMEAVGILAGGVAHNFNNNLAIILGNMELAQLNVRNEQKVHELLGNAKTAILRSRDLVQQILTYSRKGLNEKVLISPAVVVEETLKLLRATIPTSVTLSHDFSHEVQSVMIDADVGQVQEVLINLCTNAVQATNEAGEIRIFLDRVTLGPGDIPAQYQRTAGDYVRIAVQDNGCGIAEEDLDRIFDPFFTTREVNKGTGMGLATVHGIVEQHEGLIKVSSRPQAGSLFEVFFSVINRSAEARPVGRMSELSCGPERILFVDDDEMLTELGGMMLTEMGFDVTMETSSIGALAKIQADPDYFDLLITDQTMPGLSGVELILKAHEIRPELPTILCTGYSSKISEEDAARYGIQAFCMKPLEMQALQQVVRKTLDALRP